MATRALVNGAAGFIGSTLSERPLAGGAQITGVDCLTDYYDPALKRRNLEPASRHPAFRLLELDLGAADLAALPEVDVVFHQATHAGPCAPSRRSPRPRARPARPAGGSR